MAIFAHLKHTQVANWASECSAAAVGQNEGRPGSFGGGGCAEGVGRLPAEWLFFGRGLIVFYVREGYICPYPQEADEVLIC